MLISEMDLVVRGPSDGQNNKYQFQSRIEKGVVLLSVKLHNSDALLKGRGEKSQVDDLVVCANFLLGWDICGAH
jgi:hypothetical protein